MNQQLATVEVVNQTAPPQPMMDLIANAVNGGAEIDVVRELLAMKREVEADEARRAFDEAVAAIRKDERFGPVVKNRAGHNSRRYADFEAYATMLDPIIADYGVSYRFETTQPDGLVEVTCVVSHEAGHSVRNSLRAADDKTGNKNAIQAVGSTLTYLQRYTLVQAFGLAATDDDDGQTSGVPRSDVPEPIPNPQKRPRAAQMKRDGIWEQLQQEIAEVGTVPALEALWPAWKAKAESERWRQDWFDSMKDEFAKAKADIVAMQEAEASEALA